VSVRVERAGAVVTVIVDRPARRNAIDRTTAEALASAFRDFDDDPTAHAAVLWGAGGTFCAGADLHAVASGDMPRVEPDGDAPLGVSRMELRKPVVAAIAGYAVAGGLELALWCDLRVAEDDAVLGVFCRRWGVPLIDGGTARLPRVVGLGRALDLVLTGRPVGAAEALAMGLVNRVVPKGEARAAAEALAAEMAAFPQGCLRADRAGVYAALGQPLEAAMAAEFARGRGVLESEAVPGAQRFAAGAGRHGRFGE
jgi:enoyl-CoA hydratase